MATENKIPEIIKSSLESIRSMVDANTIIGDPIEAAGGTVIIPVSKVSVGMASGGIDYNGKQSSPAQRQNFGGGGGTGMTIAPMGFLVCNKDGEVDFINANAKFTPNPIDQITDFIEKTPAIIAKLKEVFGKKNEG